MTDGIRELKRRAGINEDSSVNEQNDVDDQKLIRGLVMVKDYLSAGKTDEALYIVDQMLSAMKKRSGPTS